MVEKVGESRSGSGGDEGTVDEIGPFKNVLSDEVNANVKVTVEVPFMPNPAFASE